MLPPTCALTVEVEMTSTLSTKTSWASCSGPPTCSSPRLRLFTAMLARPLRGDTSEGVGTSGEESISPAPLFSL